MVFNQQQALEDIDALTYLWDSANESRASESRREIMRLIKRRESLLDVEEVDMTTGKKEYDLIDGKPRKLRLIMKPPIDKNTKKRITTQERNSRFDADTPRINELLGR